MTSQKVAKSTNFSRVAKTFGIVLLAFFCALFVHIANHWFLASDNPAALRDGITVATSDDASYFRSALNFIESGIWKGSNAGVGALILRSPGYGMIFGLFAYIFGETNGLLALVLFQLIMWSIAVGAIPFLAQSLGLNEKLSWWSAIFISLMPMFYGFLSYTLTEALTPSLVIYFYTFLFLGIGKSRKLIVLSAITLGFLILIRPALILLVVSYIPFFRILKKWFLPLLFFALLPTLLWQLRVHRFTRRFDLHPIYHADANDLYRPLHKAAWDFHKMTGQSGVDFHQSMAELWQAAEGSISDSSATTGALNRLHGSVLQTFDQEELESVYSQYITILKQQIPFRSTSQPINQTLAGEEDLIARFQSMEKHYVSENFARAWLIGPAAVVEELVVHSNLSLYLFQKPLRGNFLMEVLRWVSLAVHLFIYLFIIVFIFRKKNLVSIAFATPALLFFFYLIFVQRGVEERYMLPYLVPLFLLGIYTLTSFLPERIKKVYLQTE